MFHFVGSQFCIWKDVLLKAILISKFDHRICALTLLSWISNTLFTTLRDANSSAIQTISKKTRLTYLLGEKNTIPHKNPKGMFYHICFLTA